MRYDGINSMLEKDKNLSLEIDHVDRSYGIKNFRTAAIFEPNPREGEVANPEAGLDIQYLEGERREKGVLILKQDTLFRHWIY